MDARPAATCMAVVLAFAAGRWSVHRVGPPRAIVLGSVTSEVRPDLRAPPPRHGDVKVPSAVHDVRGSVHNLRIGEFRFNVLVTKRGCLRSGDVHRAKQFDMLFKGRVRVMTREHGKDVLRQYAAGDLIVIPANVPHLFEAVEDAVMAEWWESGVFETRYYSPYRRRVDKALDTATLDARSTQTQPERVSALATGPAFAL